MKVFPLSIINFIILIVLIVGETFINDAQNIIYKNDSGKK